MKLYEYIITTLGEGKRIKVDFRNRRILADSTVIMDNGQLKVSDIEFDDELTPSVLQSDEMIQHMESKYCIYKHSIPSEISDRDRHPYFKALSSEELLDDDWLYGMRRELAQASIEIYVLCAYIQGSLPQLMEGKFFWQSKEDKNFVIMSDWFK